MLKEKFSPEVRAARQNVRNCHEKIVGLIQSSHDDRKKLDFICEKALLALLESLLAVNENRHVVISHMYDAHGDLFQEFEAAHFNPQELKRIILQSIGLILKLSGLVSNQARQIDAISKIMTALCSTLKAEVN